MMHVFRKLEYFTKMHSAGCALVRRGLAASTLGLSGFELQVRQVQTSQTDELGCSRRAASGRPGPLQPA